MRKQQMKRAIELYIGWRLPHKFWSLASLWTISKGVQMYRQEHDDYYETCSFPVIGKDRYGEPCLVMDHYRCGYGIGCFGTWSTLVADNLIEGWTEEEPGY